MNPTDLLRDQIQSGIARLQASVSANPEGVVAVFHAYRQASEVIPEVLSGAPMTAPGFNRALQFCLEADELAGGTEPDSSWGIAFLHACNQLAVSEVVLAHLESGFLRAEQAESGQIHAWIAAKRVSPAWRERADFHWWTVRERQRVQPALDALTAQRPAEPTRAWYRAVADLHVAAMTFQLGYPAEAVINGCSLHLARQVVAVLLARALEAEEAGQAPLVQPELEVLETLATELGVDPAEIEPVLSALTLHRGNAAYHATVPGIAPAPLVRFGGDRIGWTSAGLLAEPFLFLTRELRRMDAQGYHNSSTLRETAFRQDVAELFGDKRFVTAQNRIELRRQAGGSIRTDIDTAVFDRKTGTLAIFELKSQDPFARSAAEMERRRDNLLYANRQVSGALEWITRHGADEILNRLDSQTARRFRAHKVFPFVLGRYLAQFNDGPAPDKRAVWASWPAVLRALDARPFGPKEANPIASLVARLGADAAGVPGIPEDAGSQRLALAGLEVWLHPSVTAYRDAVG